jgi:hypothetical protein
VNFDLRPPTYTAPTATTSLTFGLTVTDSTGAISSRLRERLLLARIMIHKRPKSNDLVNMSEVTDLDPDRSVTNTALFGSLTSEIREQL